jgi:hypothetical protein
MECLLFDFEPGRDARADLGSHIADYCKGRAVKVFDGPQSAAPGDSHYDFGTIMSPAVMWSFGSLESVARVGWGPGTPSASARQSPD